MIRPMNPMLKSRGIMTKNYTFKCSAMMQAPLLFVPDVVGDHP